MNHQREFTSVQSPE